jgi:hypothetical protein
MDLRLAMSNEESIPPRCFCGFEKRLLLTLYQERMKRFVCVHCNCVWFVFDWSSVKDTRVFVLNTPPRWRMN